jgi:phosphoribosyl 1,2-cyclic phosphate phosphodiesterase
MKIKFLGTGGSEGWPALFCNCEPCMSARKLKGKNIRTRASCLIDNNCLVDFGPDTYMHKIMYDLDFSKLESVLITHSHADHFMPADLEYRHGCFAYFDSKDVLNVFGNEAVKEKFNEKLWDKGVESSVRFTVVNPFNYYKLDDIEFIPIKANHAPAEVALVYIIKKEGKTLLYGHDSGYFSEETWNELLKHSFNGVILDCTYGFTDDTNGHMGVNDNRRVKERLIQSGAAGEDTKFIITHFSHNSRMLHDELEKNVKEDDFIVAYDGMEIEI